ncbi:hypothetical protein AGR4C_pa50001 [Agrobacterium tumefaciens str. Kerr 14]|uniref:Uncharacterized protein n=2 Tax=Agrobacterium tumefaciens TaxID=358 RepID=A0A1S7SA34_AGRTU|nr:hypothetical protein AGR4C_pa50001 [Agrobacterium tumefaciens str. Kerr 14]
MGCKTFLATNPAELEDALAKAKSLDGPTVIVVKAETRGGSIGSELWWEVGVAEVSELDRVKAARKRYDAGKAKQKVMV